ncbi:MAG: tRNA adenosine(34) deaminase TadA [Gammaproteobacteria bacterium]
MGVSDNATDERWMRRALELARRAAELGEVPIGAVLVDGDEVVGEGYNQPISSHDPTAHAEIVALRQAAARARNYRLPGTTLYVTLEPCAMCAGAMIQARVARVVYGAGDSRNGACGTVFNVLQAERLNHRAEVRGGVLGDACAELLRGFFRERRQQGSYGRFV